MNRTNYAIDELEKTCDNIIETTQKKQKELSHKMAFVCLKKITEYENTANN